MKIIKSMLYIAVVTIALTYFSCNSKLTENKDVKHTQTTNKAANGGTGTPAVQTEEEKLKDDIAKEANCPSTAPTYDYNTFVNLPDNVAKLHWLRCALKTQVAIDALKIATGGQSQQTLLHSAAGKGDLESVKLLVNIVKIDVNTQDNLGQTVLMWAANDHLDIVQYLVSAGANVNAQDIHEKTALMWAASNGYSDIVKYLVSAGANVNAQDNSKSTALMRVAADDRLNIVQYLVSAGADVNMQNGEGWTALMMAARNDHLDIVQYLATPKPNGAGADVTLVDSAQKTACGQQVIASLSDAQELKTAMRDCH